MQHFSDFLRRTTITLGALAISTTAAMADPIATVLSIVGDANGPQGGIEAGDRIEDGLIIQTNAKTQMELQFDDGTLMAIGPNSRIEISSVLMNSNGQASRFAINATGGSFRLLSGNTDREAYEITTPASTIGIRGTEFDVLVSPRKTAVTLYRGALEMCLTDSDKCWAFRGSCYVAEADLDRQRVRGLLKPDILSYLPLFPYTEDQSGLSQDLWTNINACNKYDDDDDRSPSTDEIETDVEGISEEAEEPTEEDPVTEDPVVEDTVEASCEFDGEGLLCYDPVSDSFYYDFSSDV